ncbi:MAG: hypothetical protein HRT42_09590 [Campylobacteraceae bacterium]|nr:hypothetical protein [Campylobacteraceae bacterium]
MFKAISLILDFLGIISQNPILQKITIFAFFFTLVSYTVTFFIDKVSVDLGSISEILVLASYLGFLSALKVVFNIIISGFIAKQILAFIRS